MPACLPNYRTFVEKIVEKWLEMRRPVQRSANTDHNVTVRLVLASDNTIGVLSIAMANLGRKARTHKQNCFAQLLRTMRECQNLRYTECLFQPSTPRKMLPELIRHKIKWVKPISQILTLYAWYQRSPEGCFLEPEKFRRLLWLFCAVSVEMSTIAMAVLCSISRNASEQGFGLT